MNDRQLEEVRQRELQLIDQYMDTVNRIIGYYEERKINYDSMIAGLNAAAANYRLVATSF